MRFFATADTDIGISKNINQDSILIKHGLTEYGEILMCIICDGMGGLQKGELASATVIRAFNEWFNNELPIKLINIDIEAIAANWLLILKNLNNKIFEYNKSINGSGMGTTFSGILFIGEQYVLAHVGDSRIYSINPALAQLTKDHTLVEREVSQGIITREQARTDKRRNVLLQCIGAAKTVNPQMNIGKTHKGIYMICSDGFRHEINENEMQFYLDSTKLLDKNIMHANAKYLIEQAKNRNEKDNISVILIKVE